MPVTQAVSSSAQCRNPAQICLQKAGCGDRGILDTMWALQPNKLGTKLGLQVLCLGQYTLWQVMSLITLASSFAVWITSSSGQEVLLQSSLMMTRIQWPAMSHGHNSPVPPNAGALPSLGLLPGGVFSALFCPKGSHLASLPPRVWHCMAACPAQGIAGNTCPEAGDWHW